LESSFSWNEMTYVPDTWFIETFVAGGMNAARAGSDGG
jgi:hypothetical protein